MNALEGGLKGSPLELNSFRNPTSTQEGGILFSLQDIFNQIPSLSVFKTLHFSPRSPMWRSIGRSAAIILTFASSLVGGTHVRAETLNDGNGPGCPPVSDDFKQGFRLLADLIPCKVGTPQRPEHFEVATGNSLQETTEGLMVWRKRDNWTAFTDGARTWINGPAGVQDRDNDARFEWEAPIKPEVAGIQATPIPRPEITVALTPKLFNVFEDPHNRVERRQFTPDQITNIHGIEIRGSELTNGGYTKKVFALLEKDPDSLALVKKYVRSLEVYTAIDIDGKGNHVNPHPGLAINDILGDGANFVSANFNLPMPGVPNEFFYEESAADFIFQVIKTAIAVEKGNLSQRYQMPLVQDPQLQKEQQILRNQARKEAAEAATNFAMKAMLRQGIVDYWKNSVQTAENNLTKLLQSK